MLIYEAKTGAVHGLNASGPSPAAATLERFAKGMPMTGPLSVSVPGMVGGWGAAIARFGSRPLAALLQGAVGYAEGGFPAYDGLIENASQRIESIFADANAKALFFPSGRPLRAGEHLYQPGLAAVLRDVVANGAEAFYYGEAARSLVAYIQSYGGILTTADMAAFAPLWQIPLTSEFHGHTISTMPPNSWGAALLLQLMALESEGAIGEEVEFMIRGLRGCRRSLAALAGCIADPAVVGNKVGDVLRQFPVMRVASGTPSALPGGSDTSQVVAIDVTGNAVSLLQSVFVPFGSGLYVPSIGAMLNNRMRGFNVKPGDPNCIGPRKRAAQTLAPMLAVKDGRVSLTAATPGGPGQTATLAQFLARVLARDETLDAAIAAARWSLTLAGDYILEDSAAGTVRDGVLRAEPSVKIAEWGSINFGSMVAVMRDGDGLLGAVDLRRNAAVLGY